MHSALCGAVNDVPIATIVTFGADVWMLAIHDILLLSNRLTRSWCQKHLTNTVCMSSSKAYFGLRSRRRK